MDNSISDGRLGDANHIGGRIFILGITFKISLLGSGSKNLKAERMVIGVGDGD
jgi:hypothetical protein